MTFIMAINSYKRPCESPYEIPFKRCFVINGRGSLRIS
jgi:hypothetical protein